MVLFWFWQILHRLKQHLEHEGKKLEEYTAKVKDQRMLLEKELTDQQTKLEQVLTKVKLAEENLRKLEKEESHCAALEEVIRKSSKIHCTNQLLPSVGSNLKKPQTVLLISLGFECRKTWIDSQPTLNWFSPRTEILKPSDVCFHLLSVVLQTTAWQIRVSEKCLLCMKYEILKCLC